MKVGDLAINITSPEHEILDPAGRADRMQEIPFRMTGDMPDHFIAACTGAACDG